MNSLSTKKPESSIPTKNLKDADISGKILEYIPQESAEHYKIVPVGVRDGVLEVGAIDPKSETLSISFLHASACLTSFFSSAKMILRQCLKNTKVSLEK